MAAIVRDLLTWVQVAFDRVQDGLSRGALTTDFLRGSSSPEEYAAGLKLDVS